MAVNISFTDRDSLWSLILAPVVWAVHFLFVYVFAAIVCAKSPREEGILLGLGAIQLVIFGATLVALVAIGWAGTVSWRRWHARASQAQSRFFAPHDADTVESRRRFLAFSAILLAGLSFIAVVFQTLPALLIRTCA